MNGSDDWKARLTQSLEPILAQADPRPALSAYHDMPFAIFRYDPQGEFELRQAVDLLATRLVAAGKRVTRISLADVLQDCLSAAGASPDDLARAEDSVGLERTVETVHQILAREMPLDEAIAARVPGDVQPTKDIVFLLRAGALYGLYRTSTILDQLQGKLSVPVVLFYPGTLDGPAGLRFMGILAPEHNYRPKIF
jgi:hypothetical protein